MTLKKVAEKAGVSRTTVSLVINNAKGHRVSEETRNRVLQAIEELNYRPNLIAKRLALRKTESIGLFIPYNLPIFTNSTSVQIISGVQEVANEMAYDLVLYSSGSKIQQLDQLSAEEVFNKRAVDGMVISNTRHTTDQFNDIMIDYVLSQNINAVLLE